MATPSSCIALISRTASLFRPIGRQRTGLTGADLGGRTRNSDVNLYREAAWLTTQYSSTSAEDIQDAIWYLFTPEVFAFNDPAFASAAQWVTKAQTQVSRP